MMNRLFFQRTILTLGFTAVLAAVTGFYSSTAIAQTPSVEAESIINHTGETVFSIARNAGENEADARTLSEVAKAEVLSVYQAEYSAAKAAGKTNAQAERSAIIKATETQNKIISETQRRFGGGPNTNTPNNNQIGNNSKPALLVEPGKIKDPFAGKSLLAVGTKFINLLLSLIVIAAVVVIIIAGFRMVTGGGNPAQVTKAKKAILYAILGLAVALMSFAIVQIIQRFLDK